MKCHQCEKPVFYNYTDGTSLCLDCAYKASKIRNMEFLRNAAMMNLALDDMDAITGIYSPTGRIPVNWLAMAAKGEEKKVYNNIHINQSSVGILNTGDLAKIDAVITLTKGTDVELIGKEIENLTQVIIDASDVQGNDKKEIIDLVQSLAEQIQSSRKRSVLVSLLHGLEARIQTVSAAIPIYEKLRPLVERLF
jgi:hypothetical protein